jgi:hypothetical protein
MDPFDFTPSAVSLKSLQVSAGGGSVAPWLLAVNFGSWDVSGCAP